MSGGHARLVVLGAGGRMGRLVTSLVLGEPEAELAGAIEAPGHPAVGEDAGAWAGGAPAGVAIGEDFGAVASEGVIALDFTSAEPALAHLRIAAETGAGIVIGATGFDAAARAEIERLAPRTRTVLAPNMSVGVNVLLRLVEEAARLLGSDFDPEIVELHHRKKIDAPSGTARALAEAVGRGLGRDAAADLVSARAGLVGARSDREIGVMALRGGDAVGDHTVYLVGLGERLELTHRAQSRDCLARGAVRAAVWLAARPPGLYGMADVLSLKGARAQGD